MADSELVHARYLGSSPVVMPDLAGRDRCCQQENHRPAEADEDGLIASTLVRLGDVILLDRYSAEGRADFEVLEDVGPPKTSRSPAKGSKTVKE
jgi:hypothetical protein